MVKNLRYKIVVAVVCCALSFSIIFQFKTMEAKGLNVVNKRNEELTTQIQQLNSENKQLENKLKDYEDTIKSYETALKEEGNYYEALVQSLDQTRAFAGLTEMQGEGVVITVDNNKYINSGDDEQMQVHSVRYEDLLKLVNELNASGAEAISINGERIVSTSEIRNAGNFIVINTNRKEAPFEIKAIGNSETLEAGMKLLGGVVSELSELLEIRILTDKKIVIPAYEREIVLEYATPTK